MITRVLALYVVAVAVVFFACRVDASTIPTQLPANVTYSAGAYSVSGTAVGSAVASSVGATVGGQSVAIPVSWKLGQLAGIAVRTAVRANAIGLGVQVVADWVLPYGIKKCEQYGWCVDSTPEQAPNGKPYPASSGYWNQGGNLFIDPTPEGSCQKLAAYYTSANQTTNYVSLGANIYGTNGTAAYCPVQRVRRSDGTVIDTLNTSYSIQKSNGCASGHTLTNGTCYPPGYVPAGNPVQAGDADWAKVPTTNIPDSVLTSTMTAGKQFFPADPVVSTQVQTVPLSSTYTDPTTGVSYRDYAYVTPNPADPRTADLQVVKTQVDPATGNPVTDPNTGKTTGTVKAEDPCLTNPNRVGCMDKGDIPANPDLLKSEKTITITPDSGWGPDTMACPSDIVMPLRSGGSVVSYSFKAQCDFADGVRAPVIAIAWLAAVLIALGVGSRGGE